MIEPLALVAAAGEGRRMGGQDKPKQYLSLDGRRSILQQSMDALLAHPAIQRLIVALHPDDRHWQAQPGAADPRITVAIGGASRADSVRRALDCAMQMDAQPEWVLVHDAVRPCLARAQLDALLASAERTGEGALLAVPLTDSLKRADEARLSAQTLPRAGLWRAQTPQLFQLAPLRAALARAPDVGDEAAAMERAGHPVHLVPGAAGNMKITDPADLHLARAWCNYKGAP